MAKRRTYITLAELIVRLQELNKQGYGEFKVVTDEYIEVHGVEVNELKGRINIY